MSLTWIPCKRTFFIACQSGANSASWKEAIPAGRNSPKQVAKIASITSEGFFSALIYFIFILYNSRTKLYKINRTKHATMLRGANIINNIAEFRFRKYAVVRQVKPVVANRNKLTQKTGSKYLILTEYTVTKFFNYIITTT
jgi:hypothetical protein